MGVDVEPRPRRSGAVAAAAGLAALVPAVLLVVGGMTGFGLPPVLTSPVVVLGGVALALLVNVGASVRFRSDCTPDAVHFECDLRLHYRGANRTVILAAGGLGAAILLLMIVVRGS